MYIQRVQKIAESVRIVKYQKAEPARFVKYNKVESVHKAQPFRSVKYNKVESVHSIRYHEMPQMFSQFLDSLEKKPTENLFNPWFETDPDHDHTADAPAVRRRQAQAYFEERAGRAKYLFIAEALGYQGGHFTGIAMTSERILLGHQEQNYGVLPEHVFRSCSPVRTSREEVNARGMSEPTATIVWGAMVELGIDPYEVVLWNAVPWHPFDPEKGLLSNRTPTQEEMEAGLERLPQFLSLFEGAYPIAVGRKCEDLLQHLGIDHLHVRHPANGGASKFRRQIAEFVRVSRQN